MIELDLRNRATPGNSRIPIVGIGGAGANALDRLALDGVAPANLIAVNSDAQALTASVAGEKIQLGATATHGLGTGGDPELGRCAAEESAAELRSSLEGNEAVILVAGLGGGTGSGAVPLIAELAQEAGALVIAVVTLPFGFEGKRRAAQAAEALAELQEHADAVICFENDRMAETVPARSGIQTAFAAAHQTLSQCIQAIAAILRGSEGLLPLGLDDLSAVLQDVSARCLFGHGQADGNNRSFDALSRALKNPLMDKGRLLRDCDTVLVRVAGGPDLTLDEVQLLMEEFNRYVNDHTRVLLGTSIEPTLTGKVAVSILSSVSDGRSAAARPVRKARSERPAAVAAKPAPVQAELEPQPEPEPELLEVESEENEEPVEAVEPIVSVETGEPEAVEPEETIETAETAEEGEGFELEPTGADEAGLPVVHAEEEEPEIPAPAPEPAPQAAERRPHKPRGLRAATYQGSLFGDEPAAPIERVAPPVPGRMLRRPFPEPEPELEPEAPAPAPVYRRVPVTPVTPAIPVPAPAPSAPVAAPAPVEPKLAPRLAVRRPEPAPAPEPEPELEPVTEPEIPDDPVASIPEIPEPESEPMPEEPQPAPPASAPRPRPLIRRMERRTPAPATPAPAPELIPGEEARSSTGASRAPQQEVMQFEPVTRGRFEKSEPTIVDGQDLDVPTYLRRRMKLR